MVRSRPSNTFATGERLPARHESPPTNQLVDESSLPELTRLAYRSRRAGARRAYRRGDCQKTAPYLSYYSPDAELASSCKVATTSSLPRGDVQARAMTSPASPEPDTP